MNTRQWRGRVVGALFAAAALSSQSAMAQYLTSSWTTSAHSQPVRSASVSDAGTRFLTSSDDGTCQMWQPTSPRITRLPGLTSQVLTSDIAPDGSRACYAEIDRKLHLYTISAYSLSTQSNLVEGSVRDVRFTSDSLYCVTAGDSGACVRQASTGSLVRQFNGLALPAVAVDVASTGTAVIGGGSVVSLRTIATGAVVRTWPMVSTVRDVAVSRDGSTVAATCSAGLFAWDASTGVQRMTNVDVSEMAYSVELTQDGSTLIVGLADGRIQFYASSSGALLATQQVHIGSVVDLRIVGQLPFLVSAAADGTAQAWYLTNMTWLGAVTPFDGSIAATASSPAGLLATSGNIPWIRVASSNDGAVIRTLTPQSGLTSTVLAGFTYPRDFSLDLDLSPDGTKAAAAGSDGKIRVWDVSSGNGVATIPVASDAVTSIRFLANSGSIASGSPSGGVAAWPLPSGGATWSRAGLHTGWVTAIASSANSATLATGGEDGRVFLLRASDGITLRQLTMQDQAVNAIEFSPSGNAVATACDDGAVKIWNTSTGALLATHVFAGSRAVGLATASGPDRLLALSESGQLVRIDFTSLAVTSIPMMPADTQLCGLAWIGTKVIFFQPSGTTIAMTATGI